MRLCQACERAQRPLSLLLVRNPRLRKVKSSVHRVGGGSQDLNAAIDVEHGVPTAGWREGVRMTVLELCASQPMKMDTLSLVCLFQILAH